ncbi:MAG: xanthine dehydrogenase family protein subunit M [bacterium]|nr:xanthine dehydrogenase family protein subunit M [bacterium]
MNGFEYHRPETLEAALGLKASLPGSRFIAGGTDLLVRIKNGVERPAALVSLRAIPGLSSIEVGDETRIGALTPFGAILDDERLSDRYPALVQAARTVGGVQIRNAATLGGNLCNASPAADSAPALLVHEARLQIASRRGSYEIPLEEYFSGPGKTRLGCDEIVTAILLPAPSESTRSIFLKQGRVRMDVALVSVAVLLETNPDDGSCGTARIAAGAVAPVPLRLTPVERLLKGKTIDTELLFRAEELAKECVSPIRDLRAGADYRRHLTGVLIRRAVEALSKGSRP